MYFLGFFHINDMVSNYHRCSVKNCIFLITKPNKFIEKWISWRYCITTVFRVNVQIDLTNLNQPTWDTLSLSLWVWKFDRNINYPDLMIISKTNINDLIRKLSFGPKIHSNNRGMWKIYILIKNLDHGVRGIFQKAAMRRVGG